jgi:pimeloyl-ACP methyl ester carboxylesterase
MRPANMQTKRIRSFDRTELAYHVAGARGPWIVLANGLGGSYAAWSHQIEWMRDRYRFISWDYRGLYDSSRPASGDYSIDAQLGDLRAVLAAERVETAIFMGWSMGVQLLIEVAARRPDQVSHLLLFNGTFGNAFSTVAVPAPDIVVPAAVELMQRLHPVATFFTKRASKWKAFGPWMKRAHLASPELDEELFGYLARSFGKLDMGVYFRTLSELGKHDASELLPKVKCPTLVITGERDFFTPVPIAAKMAEVLHAELFVIPRATHYTPLERPDVVNPRIEQFLTNESLSLQNGSPRAVEYEGSR